MLGAECGGARKFPQKIDGSKHYTMLGCAGRPIPGSGSRMPYSVREPESGTAPRIAILRAGLVPSPSFIVIQVPSIIVSGHNIGVE